VSSSGEICVNTLKKDWVSSYGICHILITVKCLLIYPNPESALDEEAGKLLLEDYENYCARARLITSVHATPKTKPKEFDTPSQAESSKTVHPSISISTTKTPAPRKSSSPPPHPQAQPLQFNTSNTPIPVNLTPKEKEKERGRYTSPSPLCTADANVDTNAKLPTVTAASKPVKRSAGATTTSGEKRKKGLKRL
jgi:ubiquitin-conjugating enzyme E2 S